jgi:hypothetical protein
MSKSILQPDPIENLHLFSKITAMNLQIFQKTEVFDEDFRGYMLN